MKEIIYKFSDGTKKTIQVEDEFYGKYQAVEKETKSLERKETRRNVSLSIFEEKGIEFEDDSPSVDELFEHAELTKKIQLAITQLTEKQQDLVHKVFFCGEKPSNIAKELGINKSVISRQLRAIYSHLAKILKNF